MKSKNFCALPFHHLMIKTNGNFNVCCSHKTPENKISNINHHKSDHWFNSQYLGEVRKSFLDDQRHPGCNTCWKKEDAGLLSMRQRTEMEYQILKIDTESPSIKNVEIDLGNLCNLRCLMCDEHSSSAILAENKKLKINQIQQKDLVWTDKAFGNLHDLLMQNPKIVNIRGGEPFFNKKLLELVQNIPDSHAQNMVLHITTNGTIWDQKWHDTLKRFRLVRFMISIDAIEELYEYIRYPASWRTVKETVYQIQDMPNGHPLVHCVVQNLNISNLGPLIDWCDQHSLYLQLDTIYKPDYLQIHNIPSAQKELAIKHLKFLSDLSLAPHVRQFIMPCLDILQNSKFDQNLWNTFLINISMRDKIRNNSFRVFIKE